MLKKIFLLSLFFSINQLFAADYYVDASLGSDVNSGSSWGAADVLQSVTQALTLAQAAGGNNNIYVKQGNYSINAAGTSNVFTFNNSSLHIQGGFATGSTGTDTTQYSISNTTTLDYGGTYGNSTATINVNNTGTGPYEVKIKGLTQTGIGVSGASCSTFFKATATNGANTSYSFEDMVHIATESKSIYDLENLLNSNSIDFKNCTFDDVNSREVGKGIISIKNTAVTANMNTCTFESISNVGTSAAIYLSNISESPIMNIAKDNVFTNSDEGNLFILDGNSGDFVVRGITTPISGNQAGARSGAFISTTGVLNTGAITVDSCTFTTSGASANGGGVIAIDAENGMGDILITNNTFDNCSSSSNNNWGSIGLSGADNSSILDIPNVDILNNSFTNNSSNGGGGITVSGTPTTNYFNVMNIDNNVFTGNNASGAGGAIKMTNVNPAELNITNSDFTNNTANGSGGAVFIQNVFSPINIFNNTFCQNDGDKGGAVYISNGSSGAWPQSLLNNVIAIENCIFNDNNSTNAGAIYVNEAPSILISGSTFSNNYSSSLNSAVFISQLNYDGSAVDSCVFIGNESSAGGAAIAAISISKTLNFTNLNFTDNRTGGSTGAGAINISPTSGTSSLIENCLFDGNSVNSSGSGGAINGNEYVTIEASLFANNYVGSVSTQTNVVNADVTLASDIEIYNSYLQNPLSTTYYTADNIDPVRNNNPFGGDLTFTETVANGCSALVTTLPTDLCPTGFEPPEITHSLIQNICPDTTVNLSLLLDNGSTPSGAKLVWSALSSPINSSDTLVDLTAVSTPGSYYALYYDPAEVCYSFGKEVVFELIDCTDTDGDGVIDVYDLDDDNDGVLDATESPDCFYTEKEALAPSAVNSDISYTENIEDAIDGDINSDFSFANNQSLTDVVVFEIETPTPIVLSFIHFEHTTAVEIFNAASSEGQIEAFDGDNWIVLSTTPTTVDRNTVDEIITVSTIEAYTKYRLFGLDGTTSSGGSVSEIVLGTVNYQSSLHPKAICDADFDDDGKYNHQDLDSDGDKCSDAVEAGNTNYTSNDTSTFMTGTDATENGLLDAFEVDSSGSINYTSTYTSYALSTVLNVCADTDGDGILDLIDIDDDNDGVLDVVESPSCFYTLQDLIEIDTITSTLASLTEADLLLVYDGLENTRSLGLNNENITGETLYEITTAGAIELSGVDVLYQRSIGKTGSVVQWQGWNGTEWINVTDSLTQTTASFGTQNFVFTKNLGKYTKYRLYGVSGQTYLNYVYEFSLNAQNYVQSLNPKSQCSSDFDGDEKNNHLDSDSDNDGCSDAYESGASIENVVELVDSFGENGLANSLEDIDSTNAIVNYTSTYDSLALNSSLSDCIPLLLPVELLSFKAEAINNEIVELKWITATEINNDYFTIYKSKDAIAWEEIGTVNGAGNSNEINEYDFVDYETSSGVSYYQLKQTDFDGKFDYSEIKTVEIEKKQEILDIKAYPNPIKNDYFFISAENANLENAKVELYGILGERIIIEKTFLQSNSKVKINLKSIANGVYFLLVNNQSIRIIVDNN